METLNREIEIALNELNTNKRMVELLELKLNLIKIDFAIKTKVEKIDIEICEIKLIAEIDRLKFVVIEKEILVKEIFFQHIQKQDELCQN